MTAYDLTGRKALVAGGARGPGAGMAEALTRAGASVVIADALEDSGRKTAEALRAEFVYLDATEDESWSAVIDTAIETLGGLDIVVNNAGVELSGVVVDLDPGDQTATLEVNVLGAALGVRHAFRAMRPGGPAGGGGTVITVSTTASTGSLPRATADGAARVAVDRLTRAAATESGERGYGVRVTCVHPEPHPAVPPNLITLGLWPEPSPHALPDEPSDPESTAEPTGPESTAESTGPDLPSDTTDLGDIVVFLASEADSDPRH